MDEGRCCQLVECIGVAICVVQDDSVKFCNPKAEIIFGYIEKQLTGIPFLSLIHPDDRTNLSERQESLFQKENKEDTFDCRLKNKKGEQTYVQVNVVVTDWGGLPAFLYCLSDITHNKLTEIQRIQAQKMAALGVLAGGIAHSFNNLLTGIQGRASLMLMDTDISHPHKESLWQVEGMINSAVELTKQLLGFAEGGKYEVKPVSLKELILKSTELFSQNRSEVTIKTEFKRGLWAAEIDQSQIEQVLMSLYENAWRAMPGRGSLYISAENVDIKNGFAAEHDVKTGKYVKVSTRDTGIGMDESTRQRIFDPFFTTKEMGRGIGLGLASAYGIIKNHGGIITVESERDEGTTFAFYLPASQKKARTQKKLPDEILKGSETVLLVDDEEIVINVGGDLLRRLGYEVLIARGGEEAINLFEERKEDVDIVLLDMVMPDMGGGETFDRLREIDSELKVLLASGYSSDGHATEILERGCNGFIQKPFNVRKLSQKIREIIESE